MRIQNLKKEEEKMKRAGSKLGILKEQKKKKEKKEKEEEEEEEKLPSTCDTPVAT